MICAECHASIEECDTCPECGASPLLRGRFRLIEQVGAGASGTTYMAVRLDDGARVAVKEMSMRRAESLKVLELFEREARILERLEHPGIPAYIEDFVHEAGRNTAFYLVQEFVEGKALSERMRYPNTTEDVLKICDEILEILTYLHAFNPPIIHRDIKPENIIERPDGRLALVDFGSVRAAINSATGGSTVAGTFGFMAPEQLLGRALPQSDVYAVGALAVALLTGKSPDTFIQNDRSIDLSALNLPSGLRDVLMNLLQPSEQSRPDAREARRILGNIPTSDTELVLLPAKTKPSEENIALYEGHALIGPNRLKEDFRAYLEMPTPRPVPKGMVRWDGSKQQAPTVVKFMFHIGIPFLLTIAILFDSEITILILWISVLALIMIPATVSFWFALQEAKRRNLILSEGILKTATITGMNTNEFRTTVHYRHGGSWRGSAQFESTSLITKTMVNVQTLFDDIESGELFGLKVGDEVSVLVHPSDPSWSMLMIVIPPRFDFKPDKTPIETELVTLVEPEIPTQHEVADERN